MRAMNAFVEIYLNKSVSLPLREKMLVTMLDLCKKGSNIPLTGFSFDWKPFWAQLIAVVHRENRHEVISSDAHLMDYFSKLLRFLHKSRAYIKCDESFTNGSFGEIVDTGMKQLADTRLASCVEGLLLMVDCLPTNYSRYWTLL